METLIIGALALLVLILRMVVRIVPEYRRLVVSAGTQHGGVGAWAVLLIPSSTGVSVDLRESFFDVPPRRVLPP